ncbi:MAG: acetate--CoA ligase [Myxococcales bacterium]|nr:acetate--CoA ligase [Myxococcales bacterium]
MAETSDRSERGIESLQKEGRLFPPEADFSARAHVRSLAEHEALALRAVADPDGFWGNVAGELEWSRPWTKVREGEFPEVRWFVGGELNATVSCLDRHLETWRKDKPALIWEGEPGDTRTLTYQELHREVCKTANALLELGVTKGDRVGVYLPMIPELAIAILACARIGATHSVVFGGFSAEALRDRMNDAGAVCVITADGGYRRGKVLPLKGPVDQALDGDGPAGSGAGSPTVKSVLVVRRTGGEMVLHAGRDHLWSELVDRQSATCEPVAVDAEHPLFVLYTSGTTGKPKGVVHSTGGYLTHVAYSARLVFDLRDEDIFFCTADIGWVTGHSYVVYGPLANGATTVMYEGAPDTPEPDRFWRIIDRLGVTIFYTAPTAIRAFMRWGEKWPEGCSLASLRLLGTVGEPINPEAWMWYRRVIGKERCPIVDTWWQTETGGILISPLPGAVATKPGSCTRPLPGIHPEVVRRDGTRCADDEGGYLVITRPWPAMLRTIWGDRERFERGYFGEVPGVYFTGDGARRDPDGYFWVMGRVDDVLNVAGHRLGTAEVESALVSHPLVAEAAVVGRPDELKGQALVAFVTLRGGRSPGAGDAAELAAHVVKEIGAIARPDDIRFTDALPKTRSGKIMRRLLKEIASQGHASGDTTTLEDVGVLSRLSTAPEEE